MPSCRERQSTPNKGMFSWALALGLNIFYTQFLGLRRRPIQHLAWGWMRPVELKLWFQTSSSSTKRELVRNAKLETLETALKFLFEEAFWMILVLKEV